MMQLGVIGLGTMGANLARNAARNGARVAIFNRTKEKVDAFMSSFGSEGDFVPCTSYEELQKALTPPRAILLMVKAGDAVDQVIADLLEILETGDVIIDGGNSHYKDTDRRIAQLKLCGIHFLGLGVSGGEEGALNGPSMMPGGSADAYRLVEPLFLKMAADDGQGGKCVTYLGEGGVGHFVKMVHNGIEYALMQLIAESYHLLKIEGGLSNVELAKIFATWNKAELQSFLIEITIRAFSKKDIESSSDLIDVIKDAAAQKGTGKWTTDAAMTYGVAVPTITAGVDARIMSSAKDFRTQRSDSTPLVADAETLKDVDLVSSVQSALECSFLNAYAQGFQLLCAPIYPENAKLPVHEVARIWRGGCIIRSKILEYYQKAFTGDKTASDYLRDRCSGERQLAWRKIIALGALRGIPLPAMSSALSYYDSYRSKWLPQNLTQAQRDIFGAHTYERLDTPGTFHTQW